MLKNEHCAQKRLSSGPVNGSLIGRHPSIVTASCIVGQAQENVLVCRKTGILENP